MKVPMKWLAEYVSTELTPKELAVRMTMAGLEAEKIERIGELWDNVFVGEVKHVEQHPNADRLVLADVEAGEHKLRVVTGAPNIAAGQRVPLALAGARLYDGHSEGQVLKTLKPGVIRGIKSEGMVCSEKELGLSEEHEGILVLEPNSPVGTPLQEYLGDTVIEFEITPNLSHAFSIMGIARETAALTDSTWRVPEIIDLARVPTAPESLIAVEAPDLCPRYVAIVIEGLTVAPSPAWLVRRLEAAGMRAINNIVDITNYVMHEVGQPLHAFDQLMLDGGRIIVRRAVDGEQLTTLDHVDRTLTNDMLVIADAAKSVGIAGVIGGLTSEVSVSTTAIVLESAHFDMRSIRQTARALKVRTDASARFERGMDPNLQAFAAARAAKLMLDICPGAFVTGVVDLNPNPAHPADISFPISKVGRLLGIDYDDEQMLDVLKRLDFQPTIEGAGVDRRLQITVPTYRRDVSIPVDVIEEIARITGYESLPSTLPIGRTIPVKRDPLYELRKSVRAVLNANGASEAITYVTVSPDDLAPFSGTGGEAAGFVHQVPFSRLLRIINPLQSGRNLLRPTLVPSLITTVAANLKHAGTVKLFESASIYLPLAENDLPDEITMLGIAIAGRREPLGLNRSDDQLDYFDLKGIVESLTESFGLPVTFGSAVIPGLHPGRAATIHTGDHLLGKLGEVHPGVARGFGIEDHRLAIAELDLSLALSLRTSSRKEKTVQRYLPVFQDFAIVVDEATSAHDVQTTLAEAAGPLATGVTLFDIYRGQQLGEGKKSMAYRVTFTAPDRTLTDGELVKVRGKIEKVLKQRVGGVLRK